MKEYLLRLREDNLFPKLYIVLIGLITFLQSSQVVDIVGFQWYYISIINSLAFIYVLTTSKDMDQINSFSEVLKNPFILFYSLFFLISCISLLFSINTATSIIALFKIINYLSIIYLLFFFKIIKNIDPSFIIILFTISLLVEVWLSMRGYFIFEGLEIKREYEFHNASKYLLGAYPNKNITACSIAFKIPFAIISFFKLKNKIAKALLLVLLTTAYFNLIILSSRTILISLSLCILFFIVGLFTIKFLGKKKLNFVSINLFKYIVPIILSVSYSVYKFSGTDASIASRASTINTNDVSSSSRLRYYEKGVDYFLENPIIGAGIGNFQLISIKLDSEDILSYIVPYVAHNDFIELLVETGFFGAFIYLLFILSIPFFLMKSFFLTKDNESRLFCIILSLPFFIYFIDANLNFPHYRPAIQISLILYSYIVYSFYQKTRIN
tara:strand:+ start:1311 stop:2630 length:1320 start_codon:yes stop_codon:yes gene_type:complete